MSTNDEKIMVEAPRFDSGNYLGHFDAEVVGTLPMGRDRAYLVRFEDGSEAGVFRKEIRTTAQHWAAIDALDA